MTVSMEPVVSNSAIAQVNKAHSAVPTLPTPVRSAAAFSFPHEKPYSIQLDLMTQVFEAIEHRKFAVFESPTGTGKSLSLICGAFTWLRANEVRLRSYPELCTANDQSPTGSDGQDEPEWVRRQAAETRMRDLMRSEDELKARIRAMQAKEADLRNKAAKIAAERKRSAATFVSSNKRQKVSGRRQHDGEESDSVSDDEDFLPSEDPVKARPSWHSLTAQGIPTGSEDEANLSPAVRALMAQFSTSAQNGSQADETPETTPKIIYASRTHSQLSQFVAELQKTRFGRETAVTSVTAEQDDSMTSSVIRTIALGSRKQMCINEHVQQIGVKSGVEAMNESCRDLNGSGSTAKKKGSKRCEFLPPMDELGHAQVLEFRDRAMATVRDIEDLVEMGKDMHTCPYYAARTSARQAQLVTMPYNLLLQKTAREALGISLADSVVLIDESHNLIDTVLSVYTCIITSSRVSTAKLQINEYLRRFGGRLKGESEVMLRMLRRLLEGLERLCLEWAKGKKGGTEEVWTASKAVNVMGGNLDTINFAKLERFMKETRIAQKVSGYAERQLERERRLPAAVNGSHNQMGDPHAPSAISAMHSIESFILSLSNRTQDGRVLLTVLPSSASTDINEGVATNVQLKYQLLNPSESFAEIVQQARSVILAGGTMEPISDVRHQLVPQLPASRWTTFSCSHIVPRSNVLCSVVPSGPRGVQFEFKFNRRGDSGTLDDLGNALVNVVAVVPHGVVVFLPSYQFLDDVTKRWKENGLWQRLAGRKEILIEPKASSDVDVVLKTFTAGIEGKSEGGKSTLVTGSLLLAVVGAKLSEGINFSDRLARAVVMVGMPFPNQQSAELKERMRHVRELASISNKGAPTTGRADAGQELYVNLCMKAVNQSIGRAIRHQNDFAALILFDCRYGRSNILQLLPGWIRDEVKVQPNFGGLMKDMGAFFREKRAAGLL